MNNSFSQKPNLNPPCNTTTGRIINTDRQSRSFTVVTDRNPSSIIRFNLAENSQILDIFSRPIPFSSLVPGLRVQIRHASFMTASIPPQTTAFIVRVVR